MTPEVDLYLCKHALVHINMYACIHANLTPIQKETSPLLMSRKLSLFLAFASSYLLTSLLRMRGGAHCLSLSVNRVMLSLSLSVCLSRVMLCYSPTCPQTCSHLLFIGMHPRTQLVKGVLEVYYTGFSYYPHCILDT